MKKILILVATISSFVSTQAQTINGNYLDINNIKAEINADGSLFNDYGTSLNQQFEVPKGSGKQTIFAGGLWIGGFDAGGILKLAGQTYHQSGTDFFPGPLTIAATTDSTTMANFNRVWKINQCDIDLYINWLLAGSPTPCPVDSAAIEAINTWPAFAPDGSPLAPFNDLNSNGIYEPYFGEKPLIKGDQTIFFVYNDNGGVHTETGGTSIGLEIQGMAYAYSCNFDSALYNTVFINYKVINKSSFRLDSAFIGNWTDTELGNGGDDFIGCDVSRGAYYGYNGGSIDAVYGANPPALGVVFLAGPYADANLIDDAYASTPNGTNYGNGISDDERLGMSKFINFNNDPSVQGNPLIPFDYYNYLGSIWKDGSTMTYGGGAYSTGVACDYIFPGSSDPLGYGTAMVPQAPWDESSAGATPMDKRGLGAFGPFTFQPGMVEDITFAYVYGRATSGGSLASVSVMQDRIDSVRLKYINNVPGCGCSGTASGCSAFFNIAQDTSNLFNYWVYNSSTITGSTTFLWNFGDGTTSTLAYPSHTYAASSPVNLCLTITNGTCTDTYCDSINPGHASGIFTINVLPTGVQEHTNSISSLDIYPNPASENITINYVATSGKYSIKIYDATGSLVKSIDNVKSGENNIRVSELKNGLYLLNLQAGNNSLTKRFIKQ